jgi:hypothetical protein
MTVARHLGSGHSQLKAIGRCTVAKRHRRSSLIHRRAFEVAAPGRRAQHVASAHVGDKLPRQTGFGGAEFKTYRLSVRLVGWTLSDNDSDIHLEVRGLFAPQTMVVEFRSPAASPRAPAPRTGERCLLPRLRC